jgi:hypothetical protein
MGGKSCADMTFPIRPAAMIAIRKRPVTPRGKRPLSGGSDNRSRASMRAAKQKSSRRRG